MPNLVEQFTLSGDSIEVADRVARDVECDEYDSSSAYAVGDYVIYSNTMYRCTTAIGSGGEAWNSSHWAATSISRELSSLKSSLDVLNFYKAKTYQAANIKLDSNPTVTQGQLRVSQYSHVVIVEFIDIALNVTANTYVAITKDNILPKPKNTQPTGLISSALSSNTTRLYCSVSSNGSLQSYYTKQNETSGVPYNGQFIYLTDDFTTLAS